MKYSCPTCLGHVELDGHYSGEIYSCPHCQSEVQFQAITCPPPIPLEGTLPPPVISSLTLVEIAGPDQQLDQVGEALTQLTGYCTAEERIMKLVVQSRLMSVSIKPDIIAATNRRLIILKRGMFSCKMWDALWIDVANVQIQEQLTGALISVQLVSGEASYMDKLPKTAARDLYRFCQSHEEMMRAARHAHRLHAASAAAMRVNVNVER
ncbi:MAG: PH domain-containing protein [Verrucomicrobiota bacterium]